jgi:hypothetical protein
MLFDQITKLAHGVPALRRYLVPLLRKHAGSAKWDEFLAAKYDGGRKKVPNPNLKTKDRYPEVTLFTALKDPATAAKVQEEYQVWAGTKKVDPEPKDPQFGDSFVLRQDLEAVDADDNEQKKSGNGIITK